MSDNMTATTDQWMQFYQQPLMDGPNLVPHMEGFSDATVVTTSPTIPSEAILSPSSSYTSSAQLTPKANVSKPIRRRSRASKRTPTTLLNANTTNFRALVQQFTGCPSTAMSFGVHKGPITLNFQQGKPQQIHHNEPRTMASFSNRSYSQVHHVAESLPLQKQPEGQLPQQQLLQDQQKSGHSFDYSNNFLSTSGNPKPSMELFESDGLVMDHNYSLHDLTNAFSNDIKNDDYFM